MPNLEELIEMRKSSIEKALKYYDTIEEKRFFDIKGC